MFTNRNLRLIIFLSIISIGLGVACKIIFFPLILIPLVILPSLKSRVCFILGSIFSFYLFTIPIVPFYSDLYSWIKALLFHSGRHGTGENVIFDWSLFFPTFQAYLRDEPIYFILITIAIFIFILGVAVKRKVSTDNFNKKITVLLSLILAQAFQLFISLKHPGTQYLVPALSLSIITIIVSILIFFEINSKFRFLKNTHANILIIIIILISGLYRGWDIFNTHLQTKQTSLELARISQEIETKYNQDIVISYFRSSSPFYALRFGNTFARDNFTKALTDYYPNIYFWDIWNARYSKWGSEIVSFDTILENRRTRKIIFYGTSFSKRYANYPNYKPKLQLVDLLNGENETIYQVEISQN